jgi:hypothetical protein
MQMHLVLMWFARIHYYGHLLVLGNPQEAVPNAINTERSFLSELSMYEFPSQFYGRYNFMHLSWNWI